jgi:hypothetical protein
MELFESLAYAFVGVGFGGKVEHALVFGGFLEDSSWLAVHGEGDGAAGGLESLDDFRRAVAESGERLDIRDEVELGSQD